HGGQVNLSSCLCALFPHCLPADISGQLVTSRSPPFLAPEKRQRGSFRVHFEPILHLGRRTAIPGERHSAKQFGIQSKCPNEVQVSELPIVSLMLVVVCNL